MPRATSSLGSCLTRLRWLGPGGLPPVAFRHAGVSAKRRRASVGALLRAPMRARRKSPAPVGQHPVKYHLECQRRCLGVGLGRHPAGLVSAWRPRWACRQTYRANGVYQSFTIISGYDALWYRSTERGSRLDAGSLVRERPSEPAPRLPDLRGLERPHLIAQFFNGHLVLRRGGSDFNDMAWANMLLQYCETILAARCSWRLARCLRGVEGAPGSWHTPGLWRGPVPAYAWCSAGRSRARQHRTISSSLAPSPPAPDS